MTFQADGGKSDLAFVCSTMRDIRLGTILGHWAVSVVADAVTRTPVPPATPPRPAGTASGHTWAADPDTGIITAEQLTKTAVRSINQVVRPGRSRVDELKSHGKLLNAGATSCSPDWGNIIQGGAGTSSASRLSWTGWTVVLLDQ